MPYKQQFVRNFCIIAHIDHGKSTLADRLLEVTGAVAARDQKEQVLDQMDLERERGITIKAKAIRLQHEVDGVDYVLNLIDTPGHVDFSYEVSRSLAACEGALLVVDASQGVEAQTLANLYLALEHDLVLIPVINKIDLANARTKEIEDELVQMGFCRDEIVKTSAKTGQGINDVLQAIIERVPAPSGEIEKPLQALIFDSHYDSYKGVIAYVRIVQGRIERGMDIEIMSSKKRCEASQLGVFVPTLERKDSLCAGEVGFVAGGIKNVRECRVGDTITGVEEPARGSLAGYRPAMPMVFSGLYPIDHDDYHSLREALEKLQLNDAALSFEPETSAALGFGFRCGFLGLLHLDIVKERLEREYDLQLVTTAPSVSYKVMTEQGEVAVENPAQFPGSGDVIEVHEPVVKARVLVPSEYMGSVIELCQQRRGTMVESDYLQQVGGQDRVVLTYELPLGEIMYDFYDQLKSKTRGYASFDYEPGGYRPAHLVKLDILVNGDAVDALSAIVHKDRAYERGKHLAQRLSELIPRQMYEVNVQASVGSRIIARETVRPIKKDVLAKCYGGDVTRKRKLLERQKEGKKRMKMVGNIEIPQEAFMAVLSED